MCYVSKSELRPPGDKSCMTDLELLVGLGDNERHGGRRR